MVHLTSSFPRPGRLDDDFNRTPFHLCLGVARCACNATGVFFRAPTRCVLCLWYPRHQSRVRAAVWPTTDDRILHSCEIVLVRMDLAVRLPHELSCNEVPRLCFHHRLPCALLAHSEQSSTSRIRRSVACAAPPLDYVSRDVA